MADLRHKLIEAGARSFHDSGVEPHDDDRHMATLVLDAILDTLSEEPLLGFMVSDLIAALRDTETDTT